MTLSSMFTFLWVQGIISGKTGFPSNCAHCFVHREEVKDSLSFIIVLASEVKLTWLSSRAEVMSLRTFAKLKDKFQVIVSNWMTPSIWITGHTLCINKICILLGSFCKSVGVKSTISKPIDVRKHGKPIKYLDFQPSDGWYLLQKSHYEQTKIVWKAGNIAQGSFKKQM